jgi:hypothetical protein|tara:strand:+ start:1489 stop:1686 length:198 start_codon:yes stop_codon:yes gene_type:complete
MPAYINLEIDDEIIDTTEDLAGHDLNKPFANNMVRAEVGELLLKYADQIKNAIQEVPNGNETGQD